MNGSNGYPVQPRGVSEASSAHDGSRSTDGRRGPPTSTAAAAAAAATSRAERFEDEKRRMIESCFAKVDANGQRKSSRLLAVVVVVVLSHHAYLPFLVKFPNHTSPTFESRKMPRIPRPPLLRTRRQTTRNPG